MAEAEVHRPSVSPLPSLVRVPPFWARGMACVAIVPLLGFIGLSGRSLWSEWSSLRQDQVRERASSVVGYLNITPNPSYAARPSDWFHEEGDDSLLWAGWKDGVNHWFRFGRGDIDPALLSFPLGRDTIQAIDRPLFEQIGGPRWDRVPAEARVAGFEEGSAAVAYPLRVLDKVQVVNDHFAGRPVLVTYNPEESAVSIFEASVEGRRVTLGHGGYFRERRPILYDRGTQSLWAEDDRGGAMVAVAGRRKGVSLKRIVKLEMVNWGDWRDRHPDGRLLIGADRSLALPVD